MRPEELFILSSIHVSPSQEDLKKMNLLLTQITDWNYLTQLAISRQAGPFIFKKLPLLSNQNLVPEASKKQLQQTWYKTLSRSMVLIEHYIKVAIELNMASIPFIAMKGIYLSEWLYKEIGLRQFSDIDLLVKEDDGTKVLEILKQIGYISCSEISTLPVFITEKFEYIHYPPMVQNGVSIEIHTRLHLNIAPYRVNLEDLWLSTEEKLVHNVPTRVFNAEHLLITLCIHLDKHFVSKKYQFTCFYDITNLLNEFVTEINWNDFRSVCTKWKVDEQVYPYLFLANKYFGAHLPEQILRDIRINSNEKFEEIFIKSLAGIEMKVEPSVSYFKTIQFFHGTKAKLKYVFTMIFPPPAYLMQSYKFKNKYLLIVYYPYRFFFAIKLGVKVILCKLKLD